jgi:hypothetical protein
MQGAARPGPERTGCVREDRKRSGNAADDRSWTACYRAGFVGAGGTAATRPCRCA